MRTFLRFPGGLAKAFTMSYDDGIKQDERFIGICDKYGIRATFNLNTVHLDERAKAYDLFTPEKALQVYHEGHEVAMHGNSHAFFELLPDDNLLYEVLENRRQIEKIFHRPVRGMAYPWGTYSEKTIDVLRRANVAYSRTVWSSEKFDLPTEWLKWHPTCHHGTPKLNELADKFLGTVPNAAPWKKTPYLFYVWGHTYEFDANPSCWENIEKFCEKIGGKEDVFYATNGEIYDYCTAYDRLEFTLDGTAVYNPTRFEIYFEVIDDYTKENYLCMIKPGETHELTDIKI